MFRTIIAAAGLAAMLAAPAMAQAPLKTAVDGTFAPHAFPNLQGGGVQGFNIDLAQEIAKRLGRPIEITSTQFSGIIPALNAGTYDFIMAPVTVTRERSESLLFAEGYLDTDFRLVTRRGDAPITDLATLRDKVVSVNRGSAYESWAKSMEAQVGWKVEAFGTQTDAVQAVIAGRAVANITAETVAAFAVRNNPQIKLDYLHKTGLVWATPARNGDTAMRGLLENAIECIKKDGTMAKIYEKWFGIAPRPDSAAVTIFPGSGVPGMAGYDATPREPRC
ncbi:transporter substrate-binding domain-containing protein [Phreatobacter oligotrophus]|jgi:polar amino acid transport system substrate-binding protein|uniref:transporter substrate-binding domain-containing protein n=1 Tax=Phreatobacter oligotrophus TaxID=1122261 RepID=UPI002354A73B|nr:transporter substrate-binding domain-containing protein [Phreatobacter oligotrophus]MBX9991663.1 transporter substrate-binding domain-containing protein [Phreatobacter oligotrophus]